MRKRQAEGECEAVPGLFQNFRGRKKKKRHELKGKAKGL